MSAAAKRAGEPAEKISRAAMGAAMRQAAVQVVSKLAYTVEEACEATGIGKTTLYEEAQAGHLLLGKFCGRTVIRAEELRRWFDARYEELRKRS